MNFHAKFEIMKWYEIITPAPIFNSSDFSYIFGGTTGGEIVTEHLEFIALPQMKCQCHRHISDTICEVEFPTYPKKPLYIDTRLVQPSCGQLESPQVVSKSHLLQRMQKRLGTSY